MATTSRRKVRRRMRPATHRAIAARLSPHHRAWWRVSRFIALHHAGPLWRDEHPSSTTLTGLTIASPAPFVTILLVCNRCWFIWIWQKFGSNFMFNWCVTDEHANEIWEEKCTPPRTCSIWWRRTRGLLRGPRVPRRGRSPRREPMMPTTARREARRRTRSATQRRRAPQSPGHPA